MKTMRVLVVEDEEFIRDDLYGPLVEDSAIALHFAKDEEHFDQMLRSIWRVLKPGGFLFCRLASTIGVEHLVKPLGRGRYRLPEGTEWYLVNEQAILDYTQALNGELFEYIKTTNVQNLRAMTTWCLRK